MKIHISKILCALAILTIPLSVFAVNITVPSAPGANYVLLSNTVGSYNPVATSSLGISGGTVTSVNASVPTGLTISGNPITTSGTLAFGLQNGYIIPLTASTSQWATAYASTSNLSTSYIQGLFSGSSPISVTGGVVSCATCNTSSSNVNSVFGRTGAVTAQSGDYAAFYPSFTYGSSTYYLASNPLGFISGSYASSTFVTYSYASSTFPSFGYGTSTYYLNTNPAGYVTATSAPVLSISNSDGTLTISPTSGAVIASRAAITGDISIPGTSNASTLATVNLNTGTFGSSNAIPNVTVNGKGLITAMSTSAVVAPAGTLTGTTLASNVISSSLTSLGTIANLVATNATMTNESDTNLTILGKLFDSTASVGSSGNILSSTGTSTLWVPNSGGISGGNNGFAAIWNSPTSLTTGVMFDNGVVGGINATSSLYSFDIKAAPATNPLLIASSSGATFAEITSLGKMGIGTTTPAGLLSIATDAGGTGITPLFIIASSTVANTGTSTLFDVMGDGQVTIGTTTPSTNSLITLENGNNAQLIERSPNDGFVFDTLNNNPIGQFYVSSGSASQAEYLDYPNVLNFRSAYNGTVRDVMDATGDLTLGSASQAAPRLSVIGISGTSSPTLLVASSSNDVEIEAFPNGHIQLGASSTNATLQPTVSCGSGATIAGNDIDGKITCGTGVTLSFTLTFAQTYTNAPSCFMDPEYGSGVYWDVPTATGITFNVTNSAASQKINYECLTR